MVALVLSLTFVVVLLGILVAGLLRSHADILKALHDLGAGVGDPATTVSAEHGRARRCSCCSATGPRPIHVGSSTPRGAKLGFGADGRRSHAER